MTRCLSSLLSCTLVLPVAACAGSSASHTAPELDAKPETETLQARETAPSPTRDEAKENEHQRRAQDWQDQVEAEAWMDDIRAAAGTRGSFVALVKNKLEFTHRLEGRELALGVRLMHADAQLEQHYGLLCDEVRDDLLAKYVAWSTAHIEWARVNDALACFEPSAALPARCLIGSQGDGGIYLLYTDGGPSFGEVSALLELGQLGDAPNTTRDLEAALAEFGADMIAELEALRAKGACTPAPGPAAGGPRRVHPQSEG